MILDKIIEDKKKHLNRLELSEDLLRDMCREARPPLDFYRTLKDGRISIIGELKKASPSRGIIREDFPYLDLAREYEGSVEAVSVLTEEDYFKGSIDYLEGVAHTIDTPVLCKDFIFTREQVALARSRGASSVLLIVRILEESLLQELIDLSRELGMEPLVETHTKEEIDIAMRCRAKIIGINNRDLSDFTVDIRRSIDLSKDLPDDIVIVAESGIKTREDVALLEAGGVDAILIGETFMRSPSIPQTARELRGSTTEIKICGIRSMEEVDIVNKTKPHYAGFVFAPSKRQVDTATCRKLRMALHRDIRTVGVFVDEDIDTVIETARRCRLDVVQLHGREDTAACRRLQFLGEFRVWKALPGETVSNDIIDNYSRVTDSLLFDSLTPGGGTAFDWDRVRDIRGKIILAGGLSESNVGRGIRRVKPSIVDVSSGVENINGKDYKKVKNFIEEVRRYG